MNLEKIYLIDANQPLVEAWRQVFKDIDIVETLCCDFFEHEADAMVSPANSFGIMDGGLDLAIRHELGFHVEKRVQTTIVQNFHGELPIGSALIVETDHSRWPHLIAAPTMRVPMNVAGTLNAYLAFRALLLEITLHNSDDSNKKIKSIVCPGLGTGIGGIEPRRCAAHMRVAFDGLSKPARIPSFNEIHTVHKRLVTAI